MSVLKKSETGRTAIETITVLAIMTVITFGIFYFIGEIVAMSKINELNKRIILYATERRLNMPNIKNTTSRRKEDGPYGTQFVIENEVSGADKDLFWIEVNHIDSKKLSDKLASYDVKEFPPNKIEQRELDGDQEVKIYFDKFSQN